MQLQLKPGWKVFTADGSEFGEVDEVTGDDTTDIFDGLSIATSALGQPRYATAAQVATIEQGAVRLSLGHEQAEQLAQYEQPATSVEIEPDDRDGLLDRVTANVRRSRGRSSSRPRTTSTPSTSGPGSRISSAAGAPDSHRGEQQRRQDILSYPRKPHQMHHLDSGGSWVSM